MLSPDYPGFFVSEAWVYFGFNISQKAADASGTWRLTYR